MKEHSSSHIGDSEDGAFSNAILMVGINATILNILIVLMEIDNKFGGQEYAIIS